MGQTESRSVDQPAQTLTAKADSVLVAPVVSRAQHGGATGSAHAPLHTVTASRKDQNQLVAAHLMTMRNAEKPFSAGDQPTHTITAGGAHLNLVAAFLAQHNGGMVGHHPDTPLSTVVQNGSTQAVVSAGLLNLRGTSEDQLMPRSVEDPLSTISSGGRHQAPVAAFLTKYHRDGGQHARADEPLHTADCTDRMAVVTVMIDGEPWVITDIGMRMLTARELFAAQGFTSDYIIDRGCFVENGKYVWRKLTATTSVRLVGNSVSPEAEYALIAANFAHRNPLKRRAA
jgi:DNA (cytosine-5)-methyltransferase 1